MQDAKGPWNPAAGMLIEKRIADSATVPDTDPLPPTPVLVSVIVTVPENDASVCVICHDIRPGPDESDAVPLHVPLTFAAGAAGVGVGEGGVGAAGALPVQPAADSATTKARTPTRIQGRQTRTGPRIEVSDSA